MSIYHRTGVATEFARMLLTPSMLEEGVRSGLFLSGLRRTGKTTFLQADLIPALESAGAIVIYADLWSDSLANPAALVRQAIAAKLRELETPFSPALQTLKRVKAIDVEAAGFKFGFELDSGAPAAQPTLAAMLTKVVDDTRSDVVLIVDEVQHAMSGEEGNQLLFALKAARDAVNTRRNSPGHFLFVGTGSHRALVGELTTRRAQAFQGARSERFPVLGDDYVDHVLNRMREQAAGQGRVVRVPSQAVAADAFRTLGSRPEELRKALVVLQNDLPEGSHPDAYLPIIAKTLRSVAAEAELGKVDELGLLAVAIFNRIASTDGDVKGVFSSESAKDYSSVVGRDVKVEEIQPVVNSLVTANLVMRTGHGLYRVTDDYVQQLARERISNRADF